MRLALILLVISSSTASAQPNLWPHVAAQFAPQHLSSFKPSASQLKSFANQIKKHNDLADWSCDDKEDFDAMIEGLHFEAIQLSPSQKTLLVEAGGCARGGQGSNGAMWLIHFNGNILTVLATPRDHFNGWLYSIQPSTSNGYRDVVLGWHMSASEAGLSYFRFDGKSYRCIGSASLLIDKGDGNNEKVTIIPSRLSSETGKHP